MSEPGTKRSYDARRRRERADEERRETQRRVLTAARRLFVANGYTATTMKAIAAEAGVALQSVYKAGKSKAELLHMVVEREVAGDDEDVLVTDRDEIRAIADEPDPHRQVVMAARVIATIQERSAPVQAAYREAAVVDEAVAAQLEADHQRRLEAFRLVMTMLPADRLRHPPEDCADTVWAVGSPEVFHLLRRRRGWDADRYRTWLAQTLEEVLLRPAD